MSKANQSQENKEFYNSSNPFRPIRPDLKIKGTQVDYHKDIDDYIIDFGEVDHLVHHGDNDTDFVIRTDVEEINRVSRSKYIESYSNEVGIMNILDKVRRTGDVSLLNQVSTPDIPSHEKDALGRPVQDIVDISPYQMDRMEALNLFKKGALAFKDLPDDLKGKLSMREVANLSDAEVQVYLDKVKDQIMSMRQKGNTNDESGE